MPSGWWLEGMPMSDAIDGFCFIGDPHLCGRAPGFRKDEYPRTVLAKLRYAIEYAREHRLLPVLLGDLFHVPQDNPNWLIVELMRLFEPCVWGVIGNHDRRDDLPCDGDSLRLLIESGHLCVLDETNLWRGEIGGRRVVLGGSSHHVRPPKSFNRAAGDAELVAWVTHHNFGFPAFEHERPMPLQEIDGVSLVVNGHIHRRFESVTCGGTTFVNPGNIVRLSRSEAARVHHQGAQHGRAVGAGGSGRAVRPGGGRPVRVPACRGAA
jgi:predicted phosphodiesterase